MNNHEFPALVGLLTEAGSQIVRSSLKNKYILLSDIGRIIRPEIAQDTARAKASVGVLMKFLRDNNIRPVLKAPEPKNIIEFKQDDIPFRPKRQPQVVSMEVEDLEKATSMDIAQQYFDEMSRTPLLTQEEEIQLAHRIKNGDKAAQEQMITANLRLVVHIAKEYEGRGLPLLDLINEGNIGLMKAVKRFDPAKGAKLSTYASWWIKQMILRAISNQSRTVRLPIYLGAKITQIHKAIDHLREIFEREPTDEEIAEELEVPVSHVTAIRSAAIGPVSINMQIGFDDADGTTFGDVIPDESARTPAEILETENQHAVIEQLVEGLPERDAQVIKLRFGLNGYEAQTLDEIGTKLGITRERVRQIESKALQKMLVHLKKIEAPHLTDSRPNHENEEEVEVEERGERVMLL